MMGSFVGRGNQYIQLVKVLYCNLLTNGKQLPAFSHKVRGKTCHEISHAQIKCTHSRGRGNSYIESALATYEVHLWGNRDQVMKLNSHACWYDHTEQCKQALSGRKFYCCKPYAAMAHFTNITKIVYESLSRSVHLISSFSFLITNIPSSLSSPPPHPPDTHTPHSPS